MTFGGLSQNGQSRDWVLKQPLRSAPPATIAIKRFMSIDEARAPRSKPRRTQDLCRKRSGRNARPKRSRPADEDRRPETLPRIEPIPSPITMMTKARMRMFSSPIRSDGQNRRLHHHPGQDLKCCAEPEHQRVESSLMLMPSADPSRWSLLSGSAPILRFS